MTEQQIPDLTQQRIYAAENRLMLDPVGQATERAFQLGITDDFLCSILRERVQQHRIAQAWEGPFALPTGLSGDFCQGKDESGSAIWYPTAWRNEPTLVIATTGSGKTNLSRYEALQLGAAQGVKGAWFFDFRKAEFGVLRKVFAKIGIELHVMKARDLKWNPLQVPLAVDPSSHASSLADALVGILDLPPVASRMLFQTLLVLYQQRGVLAGGTDYPTMFDLLQAVEMNTRANAQAREATILRLETILMSLRDVLKYRRGYAPHELAQRHISFQFQDVTESDQNLLVNTLLMAEFSSRVARGISNQKMDLVIFCDESSRLIRTNESSLSSAIGIIRGTGIGLTISNQSAEISRSILSNTPNKIIGRCASVTDFDVVGRSIGLTGDQRRWLAIHLKQPGRFLASLGQGEGPFLFTVPYLKFTPADYQLNGCNPPLNLPVEPATEFDDWQPAWARRPVSIPLTEETINANQSDDKSQPLIELTGDEFRLLTVVIDSPGLGVSEYPKLARMGNKKTLDTRQSLKQKGLLAEETLQKNARGRSTVVLTPTPQALEVIET